MSISSDLEHNTPHLQVKCAHFLKCRVLLFPSNSESDVTVAVQLLSYKFQSFCKSCNIFKKQA